MNSLKEDNITIRFEDDTTTACSSVIIIPEKAMTEAGYIKTLTTNSTAHSKHEFHAMAQIALSQFQDGELDAETANGAITIQWKNEAETLIAGVIVFLDSQGRLHLVCNSNQNVNKLLQLAHRFCARWVRLDI